MLRYCYFILGNATTVSCIPQLWSQCLAVTYDCKVFCPRQLCPISSEYLMVKTACLPDPSRMSIKGHNFTVEVDTVKRCVDCIDDSFFNISIKRLRLAFLWCTSHQFGGNQNVTTSHQYDGPFFITCQISILSIIYIVPKCSKNTAFFGGFVLNRMKDAN